MTIPIPTLPNITFAPSAIERIARIHDHIGEVRHAFGECDGDYLDMAASFGKSIAQLITMGGEVTADGTGLSLYVVTSYGMHVGMVFFPDHSYRYARQAGPYGYHVAYCPSHGAPMPADGSECDGHRTDRNRDLPCFESATSPVPVTGTWSLHS